ncbi:hypothetical protein SESBI_42310 [Sesbania bispinosa]|nr:hypothetical protein SESBI_42310 [Sesbania bispinosa]
MMVTQMMARYAERVAGTKYTQGTRHYDEALNSRGSWWGCSSGHNVVWVLVEWWLIRVVYG